MRLLLELVIVVICAEHVSSWCCGMKARHSFGCCGVGKCNIMCCNCDGGCRSHRDCPSQIPEPWRRRAGSLKGSSAALDRFKSFDANGDNVIDKQEMRSYFAAANVTVTDDDFFDADLNRNGFVDPHEFDRDLL